MRRCIGQRWHVVAHPLRGWSQWSLDSWRGRRRHNTGRSHHRHSSSGDVGEGAIRIQRQGAVSRAEADDGRRTDGVAVGVRIVVQHTLCRGHDQSGVVPNGEIVVGSVGAELTTWRVMVETLLSSAPSLTWYVKLSSPT